jgi:hypothetical protein
MAVTDENVGWVLDEVWVHGIILLLKKLRADHLLHRESIPSE